MGVCMATEAGAFDEEALVSSVVLTDGRTILFCRSFDDTLVYRVCDHEHTSICV